MPSNKDDDDDEKDIAAFASVLVDQSRPIRDRFRALFTLRSMTGRPGAADALISALTMKTNNNNSNDDDDPAFLAAAKTTTKTCRLRADALFRHEVAFALGQMQSKKATSALISVLKNECEHGMTRHECAEALGAIGDDSAVDVLREMHEDETQCREVRETASLALRRIEHVTKKKKSAAIVGARVGSKKETTAVGIAEKEDDDDDVRSAYSVDPVPAMDASVETNTLAAIILDDTADIWERYGAMFALRNRAQETFGLAKTRENERVVELCSSTLGKTLRSETVHSALLKHEICYVLGQLREDDDNDIAREALFDCLEDPNEHAMVRHEAAEAIGSRGGAGAEALLRKYLSCEDRVVRESCEVALDMLKENQEEDVVFL